MTACYVSFITCSIGTSLSYLRTFIVSGRPSVASTTVDLLLQKRARVTQYVLLYAKLDDLGPNPEACDVFGELAEYFSSACLSWKSAFFSDLG